MESVHIRKFSEDDIDFAHRMNLEEGWNNTRADIKRMFNYEPEGCFIAEISGKAAGHVFSVGYGRLGWIGFLIVREKLRKKGIGTQLMRKAVEYLSAFEIKSIRLEAERRAAELYRRLGFVDEYYSLRFEGVSERMSITPNRSNCRVVPLEWERVEELAEFDSQYFGANRIKVLTALYQDDPQYCFISHNQSGIAGYIICRQAETGYRVGPWVCDPKNEMVALELLMTCVNRVEHGQKLYIGVPAVNEAAMNIVQNLNFQQYSKSIRMVLGQEIKNEHVNGVFAIGGPEKG
ncbi:GNAT family N-acetyltransferase [Candidatus Bathyarchaeota archaeon]|nr:GNAT family N-acetyltransferase [Candidatus Bathyarchaeota archaeon]